MSFRQVPVQASYEPFSSVHK